MIKHISISSLRNIESLLLQPASGVNLILGENGSGKTSILEAIHLLAIGRSFRTRFLKNAVKFDQPFLQVTARTANDTPVGLQYSLTDGLKIRLNSAPLKRLSELALELPLQLIPANCHQFFEQGPRYRRQLLDWRLFHVEQDFNYHWQSYKKVLQQRNSAIKQRKPRSEIQLWDASFVLHSVTITAFRQSQLDTVLNVFKDVFPLICPEFKSAKFSISYKNGWPKGRSLQEVLAETIERDCQLGYTRNGSHAADWKIKINDADPTEVLSRGQQKLFFIALCMAQSDISRRQDANESVSVNSILLVDDISSELDQQHQLLVLQQLANMPVQCFISSTETALKDLDLGLRSKVFHVKQGVIQH